MFTMKLVLALVVLDILACVYAGVSDEQWNSHKKKHGLSFSPEDDKVRRAAYEEVDDMVTKHNAEAAQGKHPYTMEHNHMSHLTNAEKEYMNGYKGDEDQAEAREDELVQSSDMDRAAPPSSVDWRNRYGRNFLNPVQNQGQCGSCWAFAAAATYESRRAIKYGVRRGLIKLSEQNLIDCAKAGNLGKNDRGCNGGVTRQGWIYCASSSSAPIYPFNGNNPAFLPKPVTGWDKAQVYPYVGKNQDCKFKSSRYAIGARCGLPGRNHGKGYRWVGDITGATAAQLQAEVAKGPVAAGGAYTLKLTQYKSGIVPYNNSGGICLVGGVSSNHAVVIVGYGHDTNLGMDYWIVRNSWGPKWGENGYYRMERNGGGSGTCNIRKNLAYPAGI